ncbi:hypothetical protein VH86_04140 [Pantoea sp. BL1]|uniref:FitA-like ribbon-helix-helix domain-containing protein n=1 Tax=Pantoea sp. BL1 TaxID=1628190 RepID=UPI0005F79B2F|nr:Arc family DNA-binding protein [Pantoea sp. BL1]KJV49678.1 hypothetical protein VH86_04140 [Pantoea sp. BL1]
MNKDNNLLYLKVTRELKDALKRRSRVNGRSMNDEAARILGDVLMGNTLSEQDLKDKIKLSVDRAIEDAFKGNA